MLVQHVLCVCTGNTCRSPMAEALLRQKAEQRGIPLTVQSAGLAAFVGDPPAANAVTAMAERGIDLSAHRAALLTREACEQADRIAVMTDSQKEALQAVGIPPEKICVLDVPDPFGGDPACYRSAAEALERAVEALLPPFSVVAMEARHTAALARLEQLCFSEPWSQEALAEERINENALFLVAEADGGEVLGYVGCVCAADEGFITNIAVFPDARRQRVAAWLLEALAHRGARRGLSRLCLEVRASHRAAQSLYESRGFTAEGVRPRFYRKPEEDALLYSRSL